MQNKQNLFICMCLIQNIECEASTMNTCNILVETGWISTSIVSVAHFIAKAEHLWFCVLFLIVSQRIAFAELSPVHTGSSGHFFYLSHKITHPWIQDRKKSLGNVTSRWQNQKTSMIKSNWKPVHPLLHTLKKSGKNYFLLEMTNYIDIFIFSTIRVDHLKASLSPMSKICANKHRVKSADLFLWHTLFL